MDRALTKPEIGELLRRRREELGKTQAEMAAELHRSQVAVSSWESGEALPRTQDVRAVARAYGIKPELLLPTMEGAA